MPTRPSIACSAGAAAPWPEVAAAFPGVLKDGAIDRLALGRQVFADPAALKRLEGIPHPLVRAAEQRFIARARRQRRKLVVLDIPLLFETGGQARLRRGAGRAARRAGSSRPGHGSAGDDPERLAGVEARQMPDAEKRRRADIVIETGLGRRHSLAKLRREMKRLLA